MPALILYPQVLWYIALLVTLGSEDFQIVLSALWLGVAFSSLLFFSVVMKSYLAMCTFPYAEAEIKPRLTLPVEFLSGTSRMTQTLLSVGGVFSLKGRIGAGIMAIRPPRH